MLQGRPPLQWRWNNTYDIKALSRQQKYVWEVAYMHYYFFYSGTTIKAPKKASSMYPLMQVLFHLTLTDDNTTGFKKIKFLPWGRYWCNINSILCYISCCIHWNTLT